MARPINRLSALFVAKDLEPGLYADGAGLYLQVSQQRTKSWILRFMLTGKARKMGLGSADRVSLADARRKARAAQALLSDGVDPIADRAAKKAAAAANRFKTITFRQCGDQYVSLHRSSWKNAKHRQQWESTLKGYVYPLIGDLAVRDVETGHVLKVIEPIWLTKNETANRIRGRIETILNWATVRQFRSGDNPARWRGHLENALPRPSKVRKRRHHPAMPYAQLPAFMLELRANESVSARALEFTILTAARTSETIGATRFEIDESAAVWTIPAARMKAERDHRVPLCARVMEILRSLPRDSEYLFPGRHAGEPLSDMAMLEMLREYRGMQFTVHGFRSTFRDWAAELTNFQNHVVEMALAHAIEDDTEAAYRRGDLFQKRSKLMHAWANFCVRTPMQTVTPLVRELRK